MWISDLLIAKEIWRQKLRTELCWHHIVQKNVSKIQTTPVKYTVLYIYTFNDTVMHRTLLWLIKDVKTKQCLVFSICV